MTAGDGSADHRPSTAPASARPSGAASTDRAPDASGRPTCGARFRTAASLGWQMEANWTDPFLFFIYSVAKPVCRPR